MKRTTIVETIIFLYAVLFLYTGLSKLTEYTTFKEQLLESPLLAPVASTVAIILPAVEFLVVLLLIFPRWRLKGFYSALVLMIAFTTYVVALLAFSDKLPCSCGGIIAALSWQQHVLFNGVFIVLAVCGIILQKKILRKSQKLWNSPVPYDQSVAAK